MRRLGPVLIGCFAVSAFFAPFARADDLIQVYRQAIQSDPVFAQAQSTWQSQKMNLPIAQAGYLPTIGITGNATRQYLQTTPDGSNNTNGQFGSNSSYTWQYGYGLTLTQPIFNFVAWAQIKGADSSVKSATAAYLAAQQSLMQRTATAYFNVLAAYDTLRYTIASKRAVWQRYETAKEQFRVGLIAITDEYEARSTYDQNVAQQIAAQNNLNTQLEALRAITGRGYRSLKALGKLPLYSPRPDNINEWVKAANKQNYELISQNYAVLQAMEAIKQAQAGGYPALNLTGGFTEAHVVGSPPDTAQNQANAGLSLSYSPIQGGLVDATTQQARYNYVTASGKLEQVHRSVVNQTRTSFLTVLTSISKVKADRQSIISAANALEATEAGFHVGTRTMIDVLNAVTNLYQVQEQWSTDQYDYINNLISLKQAAGTLSVQDLEKINSWLGKNVRFPSQLDVANTPKENDYPGITGDREVSANHMREQVQKRNDYQKMQAIKQSPVTPSSILPTPKSDDALNNVPAKPELNPAADQLSAPANTGTPDSQKPDDNQNRWPGILPPSSTGSSGGISQWPSITPP